MGKKIFNSMMTIFNVLLLLNFYTLLQVEAGAELYSSSAIETKQTSPNLTIFHVNDLHGQFKAQDGFGSIGSLMGTMQSRGYNKNNDSFMLLDGGDLDVGGALTSLTNGIALIEVMNVMGVDASVLGNNEFRVGINRTEQIQKAEYPVISANAFEAGSLVNVTTPWTILERAGIKIGIIGLTLLGTQDFPGENFQNYEFRDYESTVRSNYDDVMRAGANLVIVLGHVCAGTLRTLANQVSDLNIPLFLGGHCHADQILTSNNGASTIVESGSSVRMFGKIELFVDVSSNITSVLSVANIENIDGGINPNKDIDTIVNKWKTRIDVDEIITQTSAKIGSIEKGNLMSDSFLHYYRAQFNKSINFGVMALAWRNDYPLGDITMGDIVAVIPFKDLLHNITLTGQQILDLFLSSNIDGTLASISGIYKIPNTSDYEILVDNDYRPLNVSDAYEGVITKWMYINLFENDFSISDSDVLYYDATICYYRTLDDLTNFDDGYNEKYIPGDHSLESCDIVTVPTETEEPTTTVISSEATSTPAATTDEISTTPDVISVTSSDNNDTILQYSPVVFIPFAIIINTIRRRKK